MIISFETKESKVLNDFLFNYENPKGMSAQISKGSFLEFKIKRFNDLIIISQKHLFDVVAKWLVMASVVDLLFAYSFGYKGLFYLGGILCFGGVLWLSKYARFFSFKLNLKRKGHKEEVKYINDVECIEKLLLVNE
jgi:hypothetical protein